MNAETPKTEENTTAVSEAPKLEETAAAGIEAVKVEETEVRRERNVCC